MPKLFSTPRTTKRTLILLAVFGVLAATAITVGISDNPLGIALAALADTALILALIYPWRTPRPFMALTGAALLGIVAFTLSDVVFGEAGLPRPVGVLETLLVIGCPVALLMGIIGWIVTRLTSDRSRKQRERRAA